MTIDEIDNKAIRELICATIHQALIDYQQCCEESSDIILLRSDSKQKYRRVEMKRIEQYLADMDFLFTEFSLLDVTDKMRKGWKLYGTEEKVISIQAN